VSAVLKLSEQKDAKLYKGLSIVRVTLF